MKPVEVCNAAGLSRCFLGRVLEARMPEQEDKQYDNRSSALRFGKHTLLYHHHRQMTIQEPILTCYAEVALLC